MHGTPSLVEDPRELSPHGHSLASSIICEGRPYRQNALRPPENTSPAASHRAAVSSCWEYAFSATLPSVPIPQEKRVHMKIHLLANNNKKEATLVKKSNNKFVFSFFWALKQVGGMTGFTHFQGQCAVRKNLGTGAWAQAAAQVPTSCVTLASRVARPAFFRVYWGPPEPGSLTGHITHRSIYPPCYLPAPFVCVLP